MSAAVIEAASYLLNAVDHGTLAAVAREAEHLRLALRGEQAPEPRKPAAFAVLSDGGSMVTGSLRHTRRAAEEYRDRCVADWPAGEWRVVELYL